MGAGSTESPPEHPRQALSSDQLTYPYSYTSRQREKNQLADVPGNNMGQSGMSFGSNEDQPVAVVRSGNLEKELDRTTGRDPQRALRDRLARRRKLINP